MASNEDPRDPGSAPVTVAGEGGPLTGRTGSPAGVGGAGGEPGAAGGSGGPSGVAVVPQQDAAAGTTVPAGVKGTRTGHTWVAVSAGLFVLIVVLVFILQNLHSARVHFFWVTWNIPIAVDLLLATVLGGLLMFAVGSLRIVQLRRAARRAVNS